MVGGYLKIAGRLLRAVATMAVAARARAPLAFLRPTEPLRVDKETTPSSLSPSALLSLALSPRSSR